MQICRVFNTIALRKAKIVYNFGLYECNRVKFLSHVSCSVPFVTEQTKQEDSQEKEKEIPLEVLEEPGEKDRLSDVKPEPFREEVADSVPVVSSE